MRFESSSENLPGSSERKYELSDIVDSEGLGISLLDKSEDEMKAEGWEEFYSFRADDSKNVEITFKEISKSKSEIREFALTKPDNVNQRKENILLVWRKFTNKYLEEEKIRNK